MIKHKIFLILIINLTKLYHNQKQKYSLKLNKYGNTVIRNALFVKIFPLQKNIRKNVKNLTK